MAAISYGGYSSQQPLAKSQSALGWLNSLVHHNGFHLFNILDKIGPLCIK